MSYIFEKVKYYLRSLIWGPNNGFTITLIILLTIYYFLGDFLFGRGWDVKIFLNFISKIWHKII